MPFEIPGSTLMACATPADVWVINLLGGHRQGAVTFSTSQHQAFMRFYGYDAKRTERELDELEAEHAVALAKFHENESKRSRWETPRQPPKPIDRKATKLFMEEGASRNIYRHVEREGMRLMGLLASCRCLDDNEDPVKLLAQLMIDAGYDVPAEVVTWLEEPEENPDD